MGEIRGGCVPGVSLGSLFTEGQGCDPTWIVVCSEASQTDGWGQTFPKWPPPEKAMLLNIPKSFSSSALPPLQAAVTPCFPRRSSKNCSQVSPRFLWRLCFAQGPSACESLCGPFKNGVSISPSPVELLHTSPTGLQCQMLQGLFLPVPDPRT